MSHLSCLGGGDPAGLNPFLIIPGQVHGDHHHWDRSLARPGGGGQFSISLPGANLPKTLRIEADGYFPEDPEGFAQTVLRELRSSPVVLHPWGRLEGQLAIRGQPAANQLVGLSRLGTRAFAFSVNAFSALTDHDGRFTLEKIPPGRHLLGRVIRSQFSHAQAIERLTIPEAPAGRA